jgi:hypothetical protein
MFVGPGEIELQFIKYFDFYQVPITDLRYYLCKILSFPSHPEYQGRRALIEAVRGRVFHDESQ